MAAAFPILAYQNQIETYLISAITSEASGYPKENLYDGRLGSLWKSTSTASQVIDIDKGAAGITTNFLAIGNHNLGAQTITLTVYDDDNSSFTSPATLGSKAFTSDEPGFIDLTAGTQRYMRVKLTSLGAAASIGELFLGAKLTMQVLPNEAARRNHQRARLKRMNAANGDFLGAVVGYEERIIREDFRFLTRAWFEANILPFYEDHYSQGKPFWYVPDTTTYATRIHFLRCQSDPELLEQPQANYIHWTLDAIGPKLGEFR